MLFFVWYKISSGHRNFSVAEISPYKKMNKT